MSYPSDTGVTYTTKTNNVDIINDSDVNNLQTEVTALKTKVGVDGSAVTTSHDYKLGEVTSTDKAVGKTATQTLTNKTLTAPVVNVGSDATGDMYYRNAGVLTRIPIGTDNQIMKINGTTPNWEAETVTVDASTTVKGISELATAAEITAGTATGGTGAALVVTPDALAASTPVFNASGLTNVPNSATYASGATTYDLTTASGTQNIAHGLGKTPKYVRVNYYIAFTDQTTMPFPFRNGVGFSNGTTSTGWFIGSKSGDTSNTRATTYTSTNFIEYQAGGGGSNASQVATVSLNSTNISLSWTKTNSPTGTLTIIWEAFA